MAADVVPIVGLDAGPGDRLAAPTPQQLLNGEAAPYYNATLHPHLRDPAVFLDGNPQQLAECFEAEELPAQCMHTFPHFSWNRVRTVWPLPFVPRPRLPTIPAVVMALGAELLLLHGVPADIEVHRRLLTLLCADPTTLPFGTPLWLLHTTSSQHDPQEVRLIAHRLLGRFAQHAHAAYAHSRRAVGRRRPIYSFGFPGMNALMCRTVVVDNDRNNVYALLTRIEI